MKYTILIAVVMLALCASASMAWFDDADSFAQPGDFWVQPGSPRNPDINWESGYPGANSGWVQNTIPNGPQGIMTYTPVEAHAGLDGSIAYSPYWNAWVGCSPTKAIESNANSFYWSLNPLAQGDPNWWNDTTEYNYMYVFGTDGSYLFLDQQDGGFDARAYSSTGALLDMTVSGSVPMNTWSDFRLTWDLDAGEWSAAYKLHSSSNWTTLAPKPGQSLFLPVGFVPSTVGVYGFGPAILDNLGTTVPEPGSVMALGTGLIGLLGFAIRRRR